MTVIVERAIALSSGVQSCRLLQSSLNNLFSCVLRFVFRTCLDVRRCRCKLKNHRWSVLNFEYLHCPLRDFDYKIRQCIQNVKAHQVVSRSTKVWQRPHWDGERIQKKFSTQDIRLHHHNHFLLSFCPGHCPVNCKCHWWWHLSVVSAFCMTSLRCHAVLWHLSCPSSSFMMLNRYAIRNCIRK